MNYYLLICSPYLDYYGPYRLSTNKGKLERLGDRWQRILELQGYDNAKYEIELVHTMGK